MSLTRKTSIIEKVLDTLEILIIGAVVFIVVYLFVGQLLEVTGSSMYPTLHDKEQILAEKLTIKFKPLERNEIVIFRHPDEKLNNRLLIKRVIGLPGETIQIKQGQVLINNKALDEPYLIGELMTKGNKKIEENVEYKIPENGYILLGDNRPESSDSRVIGVINEDLIIGRAFLIYYPLKDFRILQH